MHIVVMCALSWSPIHHGCNLNILKALYDEFGPHACSLILFEVELTINNNLETFYRGIHEGDEAIVFRWSSTLGIGHYH